MEKLRFSFNNSSKLRVTGAHKRADGDLRAHQPLSSSNRPQERSLRSNLAFTVQV